MATASFIKKMRKKSNFPQDYLAKQLNISRPTYAQLEKGERELTVTEAKKLASLFSMSLNDFLACKETSDSPIVVKGVKKKAKNGKPEIRISVPEKNIDKFKEVLLYVLEQVGAKPNIGETAVNKLPYFIDFDYYEKYEKQLRGASYIKNHFGPTPKELAMVIDGMEKNNELEQVKSKYFTHEQKKYLPRREPDLSKLSAQEITHIDDVLNRLSDKNATELSDYSHNDIPWLVHEPGEAISYESVFYRDHDHSVRNYDDEL